MFSKIKIPAFIFLASAFSAPAFAQENGQLSGDFTANYSVYVQDSLVGTSTTQYFHEKSSAEAWMFLNYRYQGFTVQARFDMFNNSPLLNPQEAYTRQGLAFYNITKNFGKFSVTAGHFYDQFGSGIVFRAFEDRNIGLDYAVQGARVQYTPNDSFMVKAFTGLQKNRFDNWPQVLKGANVEKIWGFRGLGFLTGAAVTNRTLDQATMNQLAASVNAMPTDKRFVPKYNVFAGSVYNTLTFGNISLYTEYARKTREAVFLEDDKGEMDLRNLDGEVFYTSLSYSTRGLGINLQYKNIRSFILRTSPYANLLQGVFSYLPPLTKQQAYRLPARYSISALAQGERGYQAEITYSFNKNNTFSANISQIEAPNGQRLYREYYVDYNKKFSKKFKGIFGVQSLVYDQEVYEGKPLVPVVNTITPFMELTYRFDRPTLPDSLARRRLFGNLKPSLRMEAQYLKTKEDRGDFVWGLLELNLAPRLSFSASDMVNIKPTKSTEIVHYYSFFSSYTMNQTRISLGYAKQVEGVVCTGGVCRVEPAFSGVRCSISTNF